MMSRGDHRTNQARTRLSFRTRHKVRRARRKLVVELLETRLPLASDASSFASSTGQEDWLHVLPLGTSLQETDALGTGDKSSGFISLNTAPANFSAPVAYPTSGALYGLASGDFNADGMIDLVAGNYDQGRLDVFLGRGGGAFQAAVGYAVGGAPNSVTVADIDSDGKLDLATGNYTGRQIAILFGNGDGTFSNLMSWNLSRLPVEIGVTDIDRDNKPDLVSANYSHSAGTISVLRGLGNRSFAPIAEYLSGNGTTGVAIADFNNDSWPDVVSSDYQDGTISILFNNGSGGLGGRVAYASGSLPTWPLSADVNADGKVDVILGNQASQDLAIFLGNGNGTLQTPIKIPTAGGISFSRLGDFNNDNITDLVASIPSLNSIAIFTGQANGSWSTPTYFPVGANPIGLVATDLDGNGTPDLATANYVDRSVSILRNLAPAANPHLSLSIPSAAMQGTPLTVTVTARDSSGQIASNFTGTVRFKSSDRLAQLPAEYSFTAADQGVKTFQVTFQSLGERTLSAGLSNQPSIVAGASVQVVSPFTARAGGPYRVAEDSQLILRGGVEGRPSSSVTFTWDLDGDGVFGETGSGATRGNETSPTPTYVSPSIASDRVETVRLRVLDSAGFVAESDATIQLVNTSSLDTPIPTGDEFRASQAVWPNTRIVWETTKISANSAGRKVATWAYDYSGGQPFPGIHARVFDSATTPVTGDIRVQQASGIDSSAAQDVAILEDGKFAVVWQRWGGDGEGWGIRGRIFNSDGSPRTGEFLVNTAIQQNFQSGATVSALGSDRFVITWQDPNTWIDGSGNSLLGKVIGINGEVYVSDRVLNDITVGDQWVRSTSATSDGGFLMLYTSYNNSTGLYDVYVRKFGADGNASGPSQRVSPIQDRHQYAAGIGVAPDGTYLVAWQIESADTQQDVYTARFAADGTPLGGASRVNTFLAGNQVNGDVAVDATGEFVVSWDSENQDGSLQGVYARRIDRHGAAIGAEFRVNSYTNDAQWGSSVDFGAPGELVFSWKSEGQFSGYSAAVMRTFELGSRNLPPEAVAGGPYAVTEGNALSFSAALSSDPNGDALAYSWDINGDGVFGDATGVAPSLDWSQLRALGIDGPSTVSVRVQVTDGVNPPVSSSAATLSVTNRPPTIALSGAGSVDEGASYSLTLGPVNDPGLDTVSQATVRWGDSTSTSVSNLGVVTHVYQDGRIGAGSPGSVTFTEIADADTMVNDASGFGGPNVPHGSRSTLWATNWFNPGAGGSLASYPLFKFDLNEIGLTEAQGDATFRVYLLGPATSAHHFFNPRRVDLYQITSHWDEATTTYATRPSASYLYSQNIVYYGNNRWIEWTVPRSVIQGWLDRPETNHGLMLVNELPDSFFYDLVFASREYGEGLEPQLVFQAAGPNRIQVDLTDEDGFYRSVGSLPVVVNNVAPVGAAIGPVQVVPYQPFSLQLTASDPSPVDQAAGFRFDIDWDNNGSFDQSLSQAASGTTVSNSFNALGARVVRIRVTDKDGGWSEFQHTIQVRPFYLDGELFIGGSEGNDTIVVRQGSASNTLSAVRNGVTIGTFSTQGVRIFAGPGVDSVTVEGNLQGNILTVDPNRIVSDSMTTIGVDVESWIASGQAGDDIITVRGGVGEVDGGPGSDTLISALVGDALWDVSSIGGGQLTASSDRYVFRGVENLQGGNGNDTFAFRDGQRISGRVQGGAGTNRLDYSGYSAPITVNLASSTASQTFGFDNIQSFRGGASVDSFFGPNVGSKWSIESNALTVLNQTHSIEGFEVLNGGSASDEFEIRAAVSSGPRVLGGIGVDTLSFSQRADDIVVDRQLRTATSLAGFDNIENFTGGTGRDTWIGLNTATAWTLAASGVASIPGTNLLGFERLVGGTGADTFQVTSGGVQTEIDAGAGSDWIIAPNVANEWTIDGMGSGRIQNGVSFTQVENLRGGTSTDRWSISSSGGGIASIDGSSGDDTLDYSSWTTPLEFQLATRTANGVQQFNSIESIRGGSAIDSAFGPNAATQYTVNGPDAVLTSGVQFTSVERWTAGAGNDVFTLSTGSARITGWIDAGAGADSLNGFNTASEWRLTGLQSGTLNGTNAFQRMENLNGNAAADQFLVFPSASGFGVIHGGSGNDTLDYAAYGTTVSVGVAPAVAPGMASFTAIETVIGSGVADSIVGPNTATAWSISGPDAGRVGALNFSSFENLLGGSAADTFQWTSATAALSGQVLGGLGVDQVTGFGMDNTWSLDAPNSGNLNGRFAFSGIENLLGGALNDTYQMKPLASGFGTINGASGSDVIDYSTYGAAISIGLTPAVAPGMTSYTGIETLIGSALQDSIQGPNTATTWTLSGPDAGRIGTTHFASFENLIGGSGADIFQWTTSSASLTGTAIGGLGVDQVTAFAMDNTWSLQGAQAGNLNSRFAFSGIENLLGGGLSDAFVMAPTAGGFGTVNGGAGTDTVDYSAYGSAISVSLASNASTGIGLVQGIERWNGSTFQDRFTGPNTASVWSISGDRAGRVGTVDFVSFEEIQGGSSSDSFSFTASTSRIPSVSGGAGTDTLVGFLQQNNWSVTDVGAGTLNGDSQFAEFENLTGGGAEDRFAMGVNGRVPGTLSGGAGSNTLSYAAWILPVQINQVTGVATSIGVLASNFAILIGGSGNDVISAFSSLSSVLIGNAGDDTLTGSLNRDILIGGVGADILRGLGADDILLGGWSSLDNESSALQSLIAEWNSARSVTDRINNIRGNIITGAPLNAGVYLTQVPGSSTVFDDESIDTLFGSTGNDWFLASVDDVLSDRLLTEVWDELV